MTKLPPGECVQLQKDYRVYKAVQTAEGATVLEMTAPSGSRVVVTEEESRNPSHVRCEKVIPEYFENGETDGQAPVTKNKRYSVGISVRAEDFDPSPENPSTGGIHCFLEKEAAKKWKEQADI